MRTFSADTRTHLTPQLSEKPARAVTVKLLARHTREDSWPTHQFRKKRASYDRQSGLGLLLQSLCQMLTALTLMDGLHD